MTTQIAQTVYALEKAINHVAKPHGNVTIELTGIEDGGYFGRLVLTANFSGFQLQRCFNVAKRLIAENDRLDESVREALYEMSATSSSGGTAHMLVKVAI